MAEFQESVLYKGKVKIKFYPESHRYYVDGKPKSGVTTFIGIKDKSRPLVMWATELFRDHLLAIKGTISHDDVYAGSTLHEERKQEAANIGTEVHDWVEQYVKGTSPEMPQSQEAQIGVNAFLDWEAANKVKFLSSERVVYSKKHDFIGKMDIEAMVNGKLCLIDIKTSNGMYNDYAMQTAAYVRADEEETGKKYSGRWLIRLAKETEREYLARMAKKNADRMRKGREAITPPAYEVFETKFLDDEATNMERDFQAFLHAKALFLWNKETDFFTNKAAA
jgi:hypothetical protein